MSNGAISTLSEMSFLEDNKKDQAEQHIVRVELEELRLDFKYFKEPTLQEVSSKVCKKVYFSD